jgi:hypothetical protein
VAKEQKTNNIYVEKALVLNRRVANLAPVVLRGQNNERNTSMTTSKRVAPKASKELSSKKSTKEERSVAGSDLSQAKGKKKGK